jgi:glycine/D-amino acid oxidase-like deaminating enzyme
MQLSYWEKSTYFTSVDVAIIGSGIVGLHAAIFLKKNNPSLKILVIERGFIPYGASTRNAGFACFGSVSELLDDIENETEEDVFSRVQMRWKGLQGLRKLVGDDNLHFQLKGGYEIFTKSDIALFEKCEDKIAYLNNRLKDITREKETFAIKNQKISSFGLNGIKNLIANKLEGQLDSGKMMLALLQMAQQAGVLFLNGIDVLKLNSAEKGMEMETDQAFSIQSRKVLVCTNAFANKLLPDENIKPGRAQVLVTSPVSKLKINGTFHYLKGYYYFRDVDNRILLGGGRNLDFEGETTTEFSTTTGIQNSLEKMLTEIILPDTPFSIEQRWSGIMGLGSSKSPIVKKINDHLYCAIRMGGMGVAIGNEVGKGVSALITSDL